MSRGNKGNPWALVLGNPARKNDNITLETTSKWRKTQRYGLPTLGSVQAEAENLPQGESGLVYVRRDNMQGTCA